MKILTRTLICGGALLLTLNVAQAVSAADAPQNMPPMTQPITANPLAGTQWELVSPTYKELKDAPFLRFENDSLGAGVGLNAIGGSYTISSKSLKIGPLISTKMAGPPALMKAENRYSKELAGVKNFEISPDGQTLILKGKKTLKYRAATQRSNQLDFTQWKLTSPTYPGLKNAPFLKFTDERMSASVGLNSLAGSFKASNGKLEVSSLLSTQMAGTPELMSAEDQYAKSLAGARTYELSEDGKTLILRGASELTFESNGVMPQGYVADGIKIINVAPQLGAQMDGDKAPKYLQLEDLTQGVSWGRFTEAKIEGFDFVPGNRYQVRVQVERDARTGEKRLRLLDIISQSYMGKVELGANDVIWEVAPVKVDCMGVAPMKCLQVREVGGQWMNFSSPIEGFDFVEGFRYKLIVMQTKIENPPADASSIRYQLVQLLDKMPVTY